MLNDDDRGATDTPPARRRPPRPVLTPAPHAEAETPAAPAPSVVTQPAVPDRPRRRLPREAAFGLAVVVVLAGCLALGLVSHGSRDASGTPARAADSAAAIAPPVTDATTPDDAAPIPEETSAEETSAPETTAPAEPTSTVSTAARRHETRRLNISRMIRGHWKARLAGDDASLADAYATYVGPVRRRAGTQARWTAGIQEDGLNVMTIRRVLVRDIASTHARAVAWVHTESDEGGCADWTMRYNIRRVGARWRIWDSTATKSEC
jgi:hypothetical protein